MNGMADDQANHTGEGGAEAARLREELDLVRRELAALQARAETWEERLARLDLVERECGQLADSFARHLAKPAQAVPQVGGWRGRLVRRLAPHLWTTPPVDPLIEMVEASKLFDAGWYLRSYPDVAAGGERPAVHYLYHGAAEGRWAGPRFDSGFYLARYPDVRDTGLNPLVHYLQIGQAEGRMTMQPLWEPAVGAPDGRA